MRQLSNAIFLVGERRYDEVSRALSGLWITLDLAEQAFQREEGERFKRERDKVTKRARTLAEREREGDRSYVHHEPTLPFDGRETPAF